MEMEQSDPRVGPLSFKVKAASRESSPTQKAANLLEPDLRSHWSTGTNTKEWIILELEVNYLYFHLSIHLLHFIWSCYLGVWVCHVE